MANMSRQKQLPPRFNERHFPFVVQIAVPDGGFGCRLDAINAWHFYSRNRQRQARPQTSGEQQFWRWCFENWEVAETFRQRFGGEMVPMVMRQRARRPRDAASPTGGVDQSADAGTMQPAAGESCPTG